MWSLNVLCLRWVKPFASLLEGSSSNEFNWDRHDELSLHSQSDSCQHNWCSFNVTWGYLERHNKLDYPFQGRVSTERWEWVLEWMQPCFQWNRSITMDLSVAMWVLPLHRSIGEYGKLASLSYPTHVLPTKWVILPLLTPTLVFKAIWVVPLSS